MVFSKWLQQQLNERGWSQSALKRRLKQAGYSVSQGQLSHIINGTREANPDFCIGVAHVLGLPREEVFRIRGWLQKEPQKMFDPEADPRLELLSTRIKAWPPRLRETYLDAMIIQADAIEIAQKNGA